MHRANLRFLALTFGLAFLVLAGAAPSTLATEPTISNIRLNQPILEGLPLIYFENGNVLVAPAPGATPEVAAIIANRIDSLSLDRGFRRAWLEFLLAVENAGSVICTTPEATDSFNLNTLPQILLARPDLVEALQTGIPPAGIGAAHFMGDEECIHRKWGDWVWHCTDYIGPFCSHYNKKCDTDIDAHVCAEETTIQCPTDPSGGQPGNTGDANIFVEPKLH